MLCSNWQKDDGIDDVWIWMNSLPESELVVAGSEPVIAGSGLVS